MNIVDAISDPNLLGPWFKGPSWNAWRAVLKGAYALPMSKGELAIFREVAQRDPPKKQVRELWVVAGRRAGKDSIASAIAAWAAAGADYRALLRPGEVASVLCLAVDRQQARIVSRYARGYFHQIDMLRRLVTSETTDDISLSTGAELTVATNNFRGLRGRSIACAVLDEIAYWRSEESANPDAEVYQALMPGLATLPGAMIVAISSPYRRAGLLYRRWRDYFGKNDDNVLVVHAPSVKLNPTLDQKIVDDAMADDPAAARADYLAEWRDDIATYISRDLIEAAVDAGVTVRPPVPGVVYFGFADPSGGVSDFFTCAVAHRQGDAVVLDALVEIAAPFNPTAATRQIAGMLQAYRIAAVTGDRYAAGWVVDAFAKTGVRYLHSERDRSAIYADALPLFTSGRARLVDNRRLVLQFASLERRASAMREKIDHPRGGGAHDDLSNAAAGALVMAASRRGPIRISDEALAREGAYGRPWPMAERDSAQQLARIRRETQTW